MKLARQHFWLDRPPPLTTKFPFSVFGQTRPSHYAFILYPFHKERIKTLQEQSRTPKVTQWEL